MKKIVLILIGTVMALNTFAQANVAIIEGVITNNAADSVNILLQERFLSPQISYRSGVSSTGNFRFTISLAEPKSVLFRAGGNSITLYVSPGDKVYCTFDYKSILETIKFTGKSASHYNYFIDYYRKFGFQHGMFFKPNYSDVFTMKPAEFKKYRGDKVIADRAFLDDYAAAAVLSKNFKTYAEADIMYSYYYALLSYSSFKKYFKKTIEILPEGFYLGISKGLFNRDDILNNENYLNAMKMYMSEIITGEFKDTERFYKRAFEQSALTLTGKSLYIYQADLLKEMLNTSTKEAIKDSLITCFLMRCPFDAYKRPIIEALDKLRQSNAQVLPSGVLSAGFIDDRSRNTTLQEILQASKDSVIYIDFWASWCGPCKIEMPHSKKLVQRFKNKPVKFMFFSVDEKVDLWRKAMASWGVEGENYLVLKQLNSPLATHFNISGIPHYILINKKGEIAFSSAARPSSQSIDSAVESLIAE